MIMGVWGIINGHQTLPFSHLGDQWYFEPPAEDGTFVCEFWAEDDYGNVGYNAAILTVVKGAIKCIRIISERYHSLFLARRFRTEAMPMERFGSTLLPFDRFAAEQLSIDRFKLTPKPLNCAENMAIL